MFTRIVRLSAIALICTTAIATTTSAQTISIPNLEFPDVQTGWGCQLSNSCPATPDVTRGNG
jgi:hypothetical protein